MALEVFESARHPACNVIAGLRHVRRLEPARTPKKTPPSAQTAHAKRAVSRERTMPCSRLSFMLMCMLLLILMLMSMPLHLPYAYAYVYVADAHDYAYVYDYVCTHA